MPDISDVGPPATGPGLPQRIAEAPPPIVRIHIQHRSINKGNVILVIHQRIRTVLLFKTTTRHFKICIIL